MTPTRESISLTFIKKRGILILIAIVIFYFMYVLYYDAFSLVTGLSKIRIGYLTLVLLCVSLSIFVRGARQYYLLYKIGIRLPFGRNLLLYLAGLSMVMTPGSLGQAIKSYFLYRNYGEPVSKTVPLVLVERYLDILAIFAFVAVSVILISNEFLFTPVLIIGLVLLAIPVLIRFHNVILFKIEYVFPHKFDRLQNIFSGIDKSILSFFSITTIIYGWPISIVAWFFEALAIFFSFGALDMWLGFEVTTAFGFSSLMFGAISLVPGGAGVTELSFVQLLIYYGLPASEAATAVLLVRISSLWYSTLIGLVAVKIILRQKKTINPADGL
jgi:uncharacterized protein (TIRG00374 family)